MRETPLKEPVSDPGVVKDAYRQMALVYDEFKNADEKIGDLYKNKLALLIWLSAFGVKKEDGPVLDLGCGTGTFCEFFAEEGYEVTGLDISQEMLDLGVKKSSERKLNIKYINQDITDFDLGSQFGCVFCKETLPHIFDLEKIRKVFKACWQHLAPGGHMVFEFCTAAWLQAASKGIEMPMPNFTWRTSGAYDDLSRTARLEYSFSLLDGKMLEFPFNFKAHLPEELGPALEDAGFRRVQFFDSYIANVPVVNGEINQIQVRRVTSYTRSIICGAVKPLNNT